MLLRKIVLSIILGGIIADLLLQGYESYEAHRHYDDFAMAIYSPDGSLLSRREGKVKFQLYPPSVYRNMPSYSTSTFHINSRGFRGRELSDSQDDRIRIVLMGGSTAFGMGASRDEETVSSHLQRLLPNTEVINAGVIAFNSQQELGFLAHDILPLKPQIVLSLSGWNDFYQHFWLLQPYGTSFEQVSQRLKLFSEVSNINPVRRLIFGFEQLLFPSISARLREAAFSRYTADTFATCPPEISNEYVDHMQTMHQLVTKVLGGNFIVVFQPSLNAMRVARGILPADGEGEFLYSSRGYNCLRTSAVTALRSRQISVIDLDELYSTLKEDMFTDNVHFTDVGNSVLGGYLAGVIRPYIKK